jgi:pimeloyl-ACP methyl ester carboxylesterase
MPLDVINDVRIFWEEHGHGAPVVFVHGSWGDHHNWDSVAPELARSFHVVTYDRRGHSQSGRLPGQGHIDEDVADLAALIVARALAPAHVVGNSYGSAIALKLATARPELLGSLIVHEPPLIGMLGNDPTRPVVQQRIGAVLETLRAGRLEEGAEQFVDTVALGPGMWQKLTPELRRTFVFNAETWLDEMNEPESVMAVDLNRLSAFHRPALVSQGDQSPPFFGVIVDTIARALPHVRRHTFRGAGHVPHLTHAEEFVQVVRAFVSEASARVPGSGLKFPDRGQV